MSAAAILAALPAVPRHNLPQSPTALFGRDLDLPRVRRALEAARLVTLTGPGGVGKTRLALAAAEGLLQDYPDGVWLVELAPLTDPDLVPTALATTLGLREQPGQPLAETLAGYLREKRLLLVLDNCEHQRDACAVLVGGLLGAAPGLRVLATGRAPLGLAGERRLTIPPLAMPAAGEAGLAAVASSPAVALFVARARMVEPSFALDEGNAAEVAAICARLDGLPLAIELAAARIKVRTPAALLAELAERLEVLIGGRRGLPARQRTVRGLLDWSFTLLSPGEQALFARLSVFAGGWTAEAAQAVCAIEDDLPMPAEEGLASLAEQSLVQPPRDGRYGMLETVREYAAYALERLSAEGDAAAARRQHLAYFLALAEEAEPHLRGRRQAAWLARLEAEHDNLRAALTWAWESGADEEGLRLAGALWRFWDYRGYQSEGRAWLAAALAGGGGPPAARARVLNGAGVMAANQGDLARAWALHEEALALRRELGDRQGTAGSLGNLGLVAERGGAYARAAALEEEALALYRDLGATWNIANTLGSLGNLAERRGEHAQAAALFVESPRLSHGIGAREMAATVLGLLGAPLLAMGQSWRAARLGGAAEAAREALGAPLSPALLGDHERAALGLRAALGEEGFAAAWAEGRAMTPEEAVALAQGHEGAFAGE